MSTITARRTAAYGSLFFIGITVGRALSGFLTMKFSDGQMASAYTGTCLLPPLFGLIASHIHIALFPVFLAVILAVMVLTHEALLRGGSAPRTGRLP